MGSKVFHCRYRRRERHVGAAVQVTRPCPGGSSGDAHAIALRETRYVGLKHRDGRHAEMACGVQTTVTEQSRRCEVNDVWVESPEYLDHSRPRHT